MKKADTVMKLPSWVLRNLIHGVPARECVRALKHVPQVCNSIFQGFEVKPQSLSLPPIQARLLRLLQDDDTFLGVVLHLWTLGNPEIVSEVRKRSIKSLEQDLTRLAATWGGDKIAIAFAADSRKSVQRLLAKTADTLQGIQRSDSPAATSPAGPPATDPEAREKADRQLRVLQSKVESLSTSLNEVKQTNRKLENQLRATRRELERLRGQLSTVESRASTLESELTRTQKGLDRAERARDKALQEEAGLSKNVQRLNSRLAELEAQPAPKKAEPIKPEPRLVREERGLVPFAEEKGLVFRCQIDGLHYSLNIAQILRQVDTNEEASVKETTELLVKLKRLDVEQHRNILAGMRKHGNYYPWVVTAPMSPAIVDGSNVANCEKDLKGQAKLQSLLNVREELRLQGHFPIWIYVDASLPYQIDDPKGLDRRIQRGEIIKVPGGSSADETITRKARDTGACVVTNDRRIADLVDPSLHLDTIGFVVFNSDVTLKQI
ncbi:MAG: hypothetical protein HY318_00520 [Armatimonadetes bacterium]|nr:hypothetical protein [Armatimonadota bacterium]